MNLPLFLLAVCALIGVSGTLVNWTWLAGSVWLWLMPVFYPMDLSRPRGLGAWTLWALWGILAALLSRDPLVALAATAPQTTGVLLFALSYSWWGRPHRRGYLLGFWGLALLLGAQALVRGQAAPVAVGFVLAALGGCLGVYWGPLPEQKSWRAAFAALSVVFLLLAAALAVTCKKSVTRWPQAVLSGWRGAVEVARLNPWLGQGHGLFHRGWDLLEKAPREPSSGPRYERRVSADSEGGSAAAETGFPGLALMIFALAFSLPGLRKGRLDVIREWERRTAAASFFSLLLFSLAERVFLSPALLCLWFTLLANAAPGEEEEEARILRVSRPGAAVMALLCLASLWISGAPRPRPVHWGEALAWLEEAEESSPRNALYPHEKAKIYLSLGAGAEARFFSVLALALEPEFAAARLTLAEALYFAGDKAGARRQLVLLETRPQALPEVSNSYARALAEIDVSRWERLRRHVQ